MNPVAVPTMVRSVGVGSLNLI